MESLKLKALIVDDEPLAHNIILNFAQDVPTLEIVGQVYLAVDALSFLNTHEVDLLFLDIQMPKLKGLDFLRILPTKPLVIITSAHEEFALESFDLDVCDYLLKPFRFDRFLKAIHKAAELKQLRQPQSTIPKLPPVERYEPLFIKTDKRYLQLDPTAVYYLESYGNYVKVWLEDQYHLTQKTLSGFEEILPRDLFIRIHKSFLVNLQQVQYLEGNQLVLRNGQALLISRHYRQSVKALIS